MAVDIKRFMSTLNQLGGAARGAFFAIEVSIPGASADKMLKYTYLCEAAALPGVTIATDDAYMPQGFGVIQKMPWGVIFNDMSLTFIGDNRGALHQSLVAWLQQVVNFNVSSPTQMSASGYPFMVNYRSSYAATILIHHYDPRHEKIVTYTLHDVVPKSVREVSTVAGDNGYMKINLDISYTRWTAQFHFQQYGPAEVADAMYADATNYSETPSRTIGNQQYSITQRVTDLLGTRVNSQVTNFVSGIINQAPPILQNVYTRAVPLLGGIGDFRF